MANILEISRVAPFFSTNSPEYGLVNEFSIPLTLFDTIWFKFPPVECLLFYSLAEPKETFLSSVIPKLKHSLSLTLRHFLPLAGTLTWPQISPVPIITYRAPNDAVSLYIAESEPELFDVLSGDLPREATSFHSLVPELSTSKTGASILSLQVTHFPGKGFSIGVTTHHSVLDGKSATMFLKSWAHLCLNVNATSLPPELTPFFDRSVVKDPKGLGPFFLSHQLKLSGPSEAYPDPRDDPKLFQFITMPDVPSNSVRATFVLSRTDIIKLREDISSSLRSSTFVVALSYALLCIVRLTENSGRDSSKIVLLFAADFRSRMNPPVPGTYFGNCVGPIFPVDKRESIISGTAGELAAAAAVVKGMLTELERQDDVMEGAENWVERFRSMGDVQTVGVAGSPRIGLYSVDFGWGSPRKVEIVTIDRTGAVSILDTPCGTGIEIGIVLEKYQMDVFASLFAKGLDSC